MNVYLYTDRSVSALGLEVLLRETGGFQFEWCDGTLPDLLTAVENGSPDVLVLDRSLNVAFAALRQVRLQAASCKCVLWVDSIPLELAVQAITMGVRGLVRKSLPPEFLVQCLRQVSAGALWFEKALTDHAAASERLPLSPREGQIVRLLAHGMKNKEIAHILKITEGTVKVYLSHLYEKVGVRNRLALASFALKALAAEQIGGPLGDANGLPVGWELRSLLVPRAGAVDVES